MDFVYATLASAFVLSIIDYWYDLRVLRSLVAFVVSLLYFATLFFLITAHSSTNLPLLFFQSAACSFAAIALIQVIEIHTRTTLTISRRRNESIDYR